MTTDIVTAWDTDSHADRELAAEVYQRIGRELPEQAAHDAHPGALGTVSARRDGELLGWACLYRDESDGVWVEALAASRLAHGLSTTLYDAVPPDEDESAAVVALFRRAAEQAREAGVGVLRWSGEDTGAAAAAAKALGARELAEIARTWRAETAHYRKPSRVPSVETQEIPGVGLAAGAARVDLEPGGTQVFVNAAVAVRDGGAGPERLAGLFAEAVEHLRREHPRVRALTVHEVEAEGGPVRSALELSGFGVDTRTKNFELAL
ncbi:hypothetical protein AB0I28_37860 [Phytomonospora sp. NPDC050363]|uniref:hypothetical protein n=1 Tax=Phytomonospora sp. NPDC050363 TaxID=3155642 RepID=UPI0034119A8B